jgi:hypothetical protein
LAQDVPQLYTQSEFSPTSTGMSRESEKLMQDRLEENRSEKCKAFAIRTMHHGNTRKTGLLIKTIIFVFTDSLIGRNLCIPITYGIIKLSKT